MFSRDWRYPNFKPSIYRKSDIVSRLGNGIFYRFGIEIIGRNDVDFFIICMASDMKIRFSQAWRSLTVLSLLLKFTSNGGN